jgi:hypothetical protein
MAERLSPGRRAQIWNSYTLSLIPYPALACSPRPVDAANWKQLFHDAIAVGPWCPVRALSAISVVYGVNGAPRCPMVYTKVCVRSWLTCTGDTAAHRAAERRAPLSLMRR